MMALVMLVRAITEKYSEEFVFFFCLLVVMPLLAGLGTWIYMIVELLAKRCG